MQHSSSLLAQNSSFVDPRSLENDTSSTTFAPDSSGLECINVVAIDCQNGYLGCSSYDKKTRRLTCYLDTEFQSTDIVAEFKAFFTQGMKFCWMDFKIAFFFCLLIF